MIIGMIVVLDAFLVIVWGIFAQLEPDIALAVTPLVVACTTYALARWVL
jgi:hypothetical protein